MTQTLPPLPELPPLGASPLYSTEQVYVLTWSAPPQRQIDAEGNPLTDDNEQPLYIEGSEVEGKEVHVHLNRASSQQARQAEGLETPPTDLTMRVVYAGEGQPLTLPAPLPRFGHARAEFEGAPGLLKVRPGPSAKAHPIELDLLGHLYRCVWVQDA